MVELTKPSPPSRSITLRLMLSETDWIGPGKAELLAGIAETGSIAAAGRRMGMSYKRAWTLVDTLNRYFTEPLVVSAKGGKDGGGAHLTATGVAVLSGYREAEAAAEQAAQGVMTTLAHLNILRKP